MGIRAQPQGISSASLSFKPTFPTYRWILYKYCFYAIGSHLQREHSREKFFPSAKWRRMHFLKLALLFTVVPIFRIFLPPRFIFLSALISLFSSPLFSYLPVACFSLFFIFARSRSLFLSAWGLTASAQPFDSWLMPGLIGRVINPACVRVD